MFAGLSAVRRAVLLGAATLAVVSVFGASGYAAGRSKAATAHPAPSVTIPLPAGSTAPSSGAGRRVEVLEATADCVAREAEDSKGNAVSYAPGMAIDDSFETGWRCAHADRHPTLTFAFGRRVSIARVALVPGYAKKDGGIDRFTENGHPVEVRWAFYAGSSTTSFQQVIKDPDPRLRVLDLGRSVPADRATLTIVRTQLAAKSPVTENRTNVMTSQVDFYPAGAGK